MSTMPPAGAPGAQPGEPSEEEVRQYLAQMRAAPAEQVIAEVLQGLLNAAQVKLGRRDARLLLDAAADLTERTGAALSDDLRQQLDDVLAQLRMGQVQAEREVAESGHEEVNDLGADDVAADDQPSPATPPSGRTARPSQGTPGQDAAAGRAADGGGQGGGQGDRSPLDKLWIPGR